MNRTTNRPPVLVDARALEDLLELASRAEMQLQGVQPNDPLTSALRGAIAEVRHSATVDPLG